MKRTIILTALCGFFTSMVGDTLISNMFHPERDRRMEQLARYSCGIIGLFHPVKWWYDETGNLPYSFFGASFVFGLSVLFSGIFRELNN